MDSFQRSQYSIFNKNKKPLDKEPLKIQLKPEIKPAVTATPPAKKITAELPKNTILNTNVIGNDPQKPKRLFNLSLWVFGFVLLAILFFSVGYYLKNSRNQQTAAPEAEEKDLGLVLQEKYDREETVAPGSVVIKLWVDTNADGKHNSWEVNPYGFGAQIRKKGETNSFLSVETDGEGVIRLTGLDNQEEFEISYYIINNNEMYNPDRHFYGPVNYEIFESSDGSTGKIFGDWRTFKVGANGSEITLGLKEYKPARLVITQANSVIAYDLTGSQFASGVVYGNNGLPNKFEVRNNNIFYVYEGSLYKNNPLVNMSYSTRVFSQLSMSDTSFWSISPSGTSVIYGDHNGTFFQNENNNCAKQQLYYENKPIGLYSQSYPHDPVGVRFGDDYQAIIYGSVENTYSYYLVKCSNNQISVKKLPIERQWFGGVFARHDRFILKGPITHRKQCDGSSCDQNYGEGLYVYKLNEDKIERIGGDELNATYFVGEAYDGRYALLAHTEEDPLRILNFDSSDEIKILNFNIKPFFKNYDRHGLSNGYFTYLGSDRFMFVDRFGQCNGTKTCAAVKEFKVQGTNINVNDLIEIKDIYPIRIVGEITK